MLAITQSEMFDQGKRDLFEEEDKASDLVDFKKFASINCQKFQNFGVLNALVLNLYANFSLVFFKKKKNREMGCFS